MTWLPCPVLSGSSGVGKVREGGGKEGGGGGGGLVCFYRYTCIVERVCVRSCICLGSCYVAPSQSNVLLCITHAHTPHTHHTPSSELPDVPSQSLVPGDVLVVPPTGMTMPCDAALLSGHAIVNEAMLTGTEPSLKSSMWSTLLLCRFPLKEYTRLLCSYPHSTLSL